MPAYMLDTDTVSYALRGHGRVGERLLELRPSQVCISSVTLAELRYGAEHRRSKKLHGLIDGLVAGVEVASFDAAAATRFGAVATALSRAGTPIGNFDALIAAHALALGLVLVTNNVRHFRRVSGLKAESWA